MHGQRSSLRWPIKSRRTAAQISCSPFSRLNGRRQARTSGFACRLIAAAAPTPHGSSSIEIKSNAGRWRCGRGGRAGKREEGRGEREKVREEEFSSLLPHPSTLRAKLPVRFPRPNVVTLIHRKHEHSSVADFAGACRAGDRLDCRLHHVIGYNGLHLYLR